MESRDSNGLLISSFEEVLGEGCQIVQTGWDFFTDQNNGMTGNMHNDDGLIVLPCLYENQYLSTNTKVNNIIQLTYFSQYCRIATIGFTLQYAQIGAACLYTDLVYLFAEFTEEPHSGVRYSIKRSYCMLAPDLYKQDYQFIQREICCLQLSEQLFSTVLEQFSSLAGFEGESKWNLTDLRKTFHDKTKDNSITFPYSYDCIRYGTYKIEIVLYSNHLMTEIVEKNSDGNEYINYFAKGDILSFFKFIKFVFLQITRESIGSQNDLHDTANSTFKLQQLVFNIALRKRSQPVKTSGKIRKKKRLDLQ